MTLKDVTKKVISSNESNKENFIEEITPYANDAALELGVDPKVLIAQAGIETGWGKHIAKNADGTPSNNLFNIKTTKGWKGKSTTITTHEIESGKSVKQKASFRSYSSYKESFQDYTKFIKENKRYSKAIEAGAKGDSAGYIKEISKAGYATDISYSSKVLKTAAGIGTGVLAGVGIAKSSKVISGAISKGTSIASSLANRVTDLFGSKEENIKEEPIKEETKQTSIVVPKSKKKIAYETNDLTGWHKKVIVLLTDWANSKRVVNVENKNDTISINQAINERSETETVQLPKEEKSFAKSLAKGVIGASMVAMSAIADTKVPETKQLLSKEYPKTEKQDKIKEIKIPATPIQKQVIKDEEIKVPENKQSNNEIKIDNKISIQEKFSKSVNNIIEKLNKEPDKIILPTSIDTAINKSVVKKDIPKQKQKEITQQTIIISETNNTEIESPTPVFLFGDKYSARNDLKNISLSSRDFGTGLFQKHL